MIFRKGLFEGQVVAITGGGTGIGLGCAKAFASLGAKVSICGRRENVLEEAARAIQASATEQGYDEDCVISSVADVKKPETLAAWCQETKTAFGGVDCLVANAGANFLAPAAAISPNGFATVVGTVLLGTWNTLHAFFPVLSEKEKSSIIMMAATNGYTASPLMAHSGAGKAGMLNLTQTLAVEWAPSGIRVNAVAPGPVDTEGATSRLWSDPSARERVTKTVPLGRMGTTEDCIHPVLFLASPAGDFITGTTLTVDGGNFLKPLPELI